MTDICASLRKAGKLAAQLIVLIASLAFAVPGWAYAILGDREQLVGGVRVPDPYYWAKCVTANLNAGNCNLAITFNTNKALKIDGQQALNRAITTWNAKAPVQNPPAQGNLGTMAKTDPVEDIFGRNYDLETTLMHELGHAVGLDHPELGRDRSDATNTPLAFGRTRYTASTDGGGPRAKFDLDPGQDKVPGTSDDLRGDDKPLNLTAAANNPFAVALGAVDSTTFKYSGPNAGFPQTATREVAREIYKNPNLGLESVMVQDFTVGETRRILTNDDVNGLRYLQSGRNQMAGDVDDFNFVFAFNAAGAAGVGDNAPPAGIDVLVTDLPGIRPSATSIIDRTGFFAGYITELAYGYQTESELLSGLGTPDLLGRTDLWLDDMGNIAFADVFVVTRQAAEPPTILVLSVGLAALILIQRKKHIRKAPKQYA